MPGRLIYKPCAVNLQNISIQEKGVVPHVEPASPKPIPHVAIVSAMAQRGFEKYWPQTPKGALK